MLEFLTYALGTVLTVIALGLMSLAVSYIKDGKTAISAGAVAVAVAMFAAGLFGYPVLTKLYNLVTDPARLTISVCGYVVCGFVYSFIRWWRLNRTVRNGMLNYLRSFTANKVRVTTNDAITTLLLNYCNGRVFDNVTSEALVAVNYGRNCKSLRELKSYVNTKLSPTITMDNLLGELREQRPADFAALMFVDDLEETNSTEQFVNNPVLSKMPKLWTDAWQEYRLQESISFNEGFSTDYLGLRKPLLQDHMGRVSSWIVLWPACIMINTFFDFADIVRSLTDAAVKRLSKLYDKLAGDWE